MENQTLSDNILINLIHDEYEYDNQVLSVKRRKNKFIALVEVNTGEYVHDVYIIEDNQPVWVDSMQV